MASLGHSELKSRMIPHSVGTKHGKYRGDNISSQTIGHEYVMIDVLTIEFIYVSV